MYYRRIHAHCISFAASALFMTAVFCSIQCTPALAGEPPANVAKPTAPVLATSPFTEIQLQKINQYWDTRKGDVGILKRFSRLLGLTKGDEVILGRRMSGRDEIDNSLHIFFRLNNGAGYYLTREPVQGESHFYRVGSDFKVIAALSVSKDNGETILAVQDAEKELPAEYARWAEVADGL